VKIFSVTTTVNVPRALTAYQVCRGDVEFLVVGDTREPEELALFCKDAKVRFLNVEAQEALGYRCSPLIGWKSIQRRNIGFLEGLKSGADIIHSWDDDNHVISSRYFDDIVDAMNFQAGIEIIGKNRWHDPGQYLKPKAKHRGFPYQIKSEPHYGSTTAVKIGVAAGTCISDPDIDSVTRIALAPDVQQVSLLVEAGYVINPYTWTVFNSQATAVRREFVPAWFLWNHVGRMDDIYASLLVQRVMRDRGCYVHCGKPFALQNRNDHNLITDMRAEIDGYENAARLAELLDHITLPGKSVLADCRVIWDVLAHADFVPSKTVETAQAFLSDCEALGL
jgi:hypothetical protein